MIQSRIIGRAEVAAPTEIVVDLFQAEETDSILAATHAKLRSFGQASETDLILTTLVHRKVRTLGEPSEADLSQTMRPQEIRPVAQTTEADTAQAMTHAKIPVSYTHLRAHETPE